jgi:hypothetical protein
MQEINVLSWNVSWEAMSAKNGKVVTGSKCSPTKCKDNVTRLIKDTIKKEGINLIAIQESGILEDIKIPNFEIITWQKDKNTSNAMIMYNSSIFRNITDQHFKLNDGSKKHIIGNIAQDKGKPGIRPYQFVILQQISTKENLVFTNLHNDHDSNLDLTFKCLSKTWNTQQLSTFYTISYGIIAGDFNTKITQPITVYNVTEYNKYYTLSEGTCCDGTLDGKPMKDMRQLPMYLTVKMKFTPLHRFRPEIATILDGNNKRYIALENKEDGSAYDKSFVWDQSIKDN